MNFQLRPRARNGAGSDDVKRFWLFEGLNKAAGFLVMGLATTGIILALEGIDRAVADESATADGIYATSPPRLLQFRALVSDAGRQASIGSGFLVSFRMVPLSGEDAFFGQIGGLKSSLDRDRN